jgi:hypothetical protein
MSTALIASSFVISKNCNMLEVNIIRGGKPKPTYDLVAKVNGEGISSKYQIHKINDPIVDCAINLEAFLQHLSNSSFFVSGSSFNQGCQPVLSARDLHKPEPRRTV